MTEQTMHDGHCLCGAVSVQVTGPLGEISACHCAPCTRWSGSMQMGIEVSRDNVTLNGPSKTYQSSSFAERAWCDICGSALWFVNTEGLHSDVLELAPGLFDNAGGAKLTRIVYADCAPDGYALAGDVQRVSKAEYERDNRHVTGGK